MVLDPEYLILKHQAASIVFINQFSNKNSVSSIGEAMFSILITFKMSKLYYLKP